MSKDKVSVEITVVGRPDFEVAASMTKDDIEWLLESLPGVEVVYWEGMNRITRTSKNPPAPVHTRAAYVRFRTPRL